ncbi:carbohydrate esterase family 1 protein [Dothidotthia symphoricarpi CBS 119687]|uniref:feruloyl esterase n=1 Tax=Dothidotthia symphoricarpi CBS 119687 TaxID=1392245 RepID=A0A6A6A2Y8_9PLEO|nr:carbohydrate esterase family 1 protein [Dothidotthia symphoricarpi CBS 119687]KAF2126372.1 carbohydrate esterase family 1 protein [Dothidotthia symphoricarpi CBS 119687]
MPGITTFISVGATLITLVLASSSGCSKALPSNLTPGGTTQVLTISSKSVIGKTTQREYRVHLPSTFSAKNNAAAPLIIALHGQLQPARSMEAITGLSTPAFNKNAIVVYPEGLNQQWLSDPSAPPSSVLDDRIFITEILNSVSSTLCIDESRIYAAGLSNGGGLTGLLACDPVLNKRFAAYAGVAAAMYPDSTLTEPLFVAGCNPQLSGRKLPIMELHGLNDSVIAYGGNNSPSPNSLPLPTWINAWVSRNGCSSTQPSVLTLEGGDVTESRWSCGGAKDVVVHRQIKDFGHGWPSTSAQGEPFETLRLGPTTWNASSLVVDWFNKWTLKV